MEVLPAPVPAPVAEVSTVPVQKMDTGLSIGLDPERGLTADEIAHVFRVALEADLDADVKKAMNRWSLGYAYHHRAEGVTWEDVLARFNDAAGSDYKRSYVFEASAFFAAFPTRARALAKLQDAVDRGYYSWTSFREDNGIGRRADRLQIEAGRDPRDHAASELQKAARHYAKGDDTVDNAVANLADDDPLRLEAAAIKAQAHAGLLHTTRVLADAATEAGERGPWRSEAYLDYVRQFACPWTGSYDVVAHHIYRDRKGEKCSDCFTVPLDRTAHEALHYEGQETFEEQHGGLTMESVVLALLAYAHGARDTRVHLVPKRDYAE